MNSTTVIKYFIHEDNVYELVYKIEDSYSKTLPTKVKKEYEANVQKTINHALSRLKSDIEDIDYEDCTIDGAARSPKVTDLENSLNDSLKAAKVKSAEVFYKNIPSASSPAPLLGTVVITPVGETEETLDDYITGMGERVLIDDVKEAFDDIDDPFEKLQFLKLQLIKITKPEEKEKILKTLLEDFNNYLKNAPALLEMTPILFSQHLEIFGSLMNPQSQSFKTVWEYLHPTLKKNQELRENIKLFHEDFLGSKILESSVKSDLEAYRRTIENEEASANKDFELICENLPFDIIDTRLHFLKNLDAFISKSLREGYKDSWIFLDDLKKLNFEDTDWTRTDDSINQIATAEEQIDELEEARLNHYIEVRKEKLSENLKKGLSLTLKLTTEAHPPLQQKFDSMTDFEEFMQDVPLKQQLQVLHFLQNEVREKLEAIQFEKTSKQASIQYLKKNVTIVKTQTNELHAYMDLEYIPFREKDDRKEFCEIIKKRFYFDIADDKKVDGVYFQESLSANHATALRTFLALESLSGRKATPSVINLI